MTTTTRIDFARIEGFVSEHREEDIRLQVHLYQTCIGGEWRARFVDEDAPDQFEVLDRDGEKPMLGTGATPLAAMMALDAMC
jgi:hypothetical protein